MNKFKFFFQRWLKVKNVTIGFTYYTKSGNEILYNSKDYDLSKSNIIGNFGEFNYYDFKKLIKTEEFVNGLNKISKKLLRRDRKKKEIELPSGTIITGDYIVKCIWSIDDIEREYISYEEYKKLEKK